MALLRLGHHSQVCIAPVCHANRLISIIVIAAATLLEHCDLRMAKWRVCLAHGHTANVLIFLRSKSGALLDADSAPQRSGMYLARYGLPRPSGD